MGQTVTRAVAYLRVSTEEQASSGLGLEAQRAAVEAEIARRGWQLVEVVTDAGVSGKVEPAKREGLSRALSMLEGKSRSADVLVVAKLDRLARSMSGLVGMLDRAEARGWALLLLDSPMDTVTPSGRMVAGIMGVIAEWERRVIAARTRDALQAKKARGARLGRPVLLDSATRARIVELSDAGESQSAIARRLTAEQVPTATGRTTWWPATVREVLLSVQLDNEAALATAAAVQ